MLPAMRAAFTLLALYPLVGCGAPPHSNTLKATSQLWFDAQSDITNTTTGEVSEGVRMSDLNATGFAYERFLDNAWSVQLAYEGREYRFDAPLKADEFELALRHYMQIDSKVRPFVGVGATYGVGMAWGGLESDPYTQFDATFGLSIPFGDGYRFEVSLTWEPMGGDPQLGDLVYAHEDWLARMAIGWSF